MAAVVLLSLMIVPLLVVLVELVARDRPVAEPVVTGLAGRPERAAHRA